MLLRHECHINVMICSHGMSWCYLFGYICKECAGQYAQGAMLQYAVINMSKTLEWNEIEAYQSLRVLGAYEAIFHILGLQFCVMSHNVETLPIHLPDKQYHYYKGQPAGIDSLKDRSPLYAWFALNRDREAPPSWCFAAPKSSASRRPPVVPPSLVSTCPTPRYALAPLPATLPNSI